MCCNLFFAIAVLGNVTRQYDPVCGSEKSNADNENLHNIQDSCFYSNLFRWFIFIRVVLV